MQKRDVALREIDRFAELSNLSASLGDAAIALREQHEKISEDFLKTIDQADAEAERRLEAGENPLGVAMLVYRAGCVLKALSILENVDEATAQNLEVQRWKAVFMMEAGRSEEAFVALGQLEGAASQSRYTQWRTPAALASLTNADYDRAISLWSTIAEEAQTRRMMNLLNSLPLAGSPSRWPHLQISAAQSAQFPMRTEASNMLFDVALCHLEKGDADRAVETFKECLDTMPESSYRPLIHFYLKTLTGEDIEIIPPSNQIPIEHDMFASEEEPKAKAKAKPKPEK